MLFRSYLTLCKLLNKDPIIFIDKIQSFTHNIIEIPVFSALYLSKVQSPDLIVIANNNQDINILNTLNINKVMLCDSLNINETLSEIRRLMNEKL